MATRPLSILLPKRERDRLGRLAVRYGCSLPEFASRVLREFNDALPAEAIKDYENPRELRESLKRAVRDWKRGRTRDRL